MKDKILTVIVIVGVCVGLGIAQASAAPRAGGLFVDSFTVPCTTTATIIRSPKGQQSYVCYVPTGSVDVYVGDSGIVADATAIPYSAEETFGADVSYEYCRVAAGTVTVACRAQVLTP